MSRVVRAAVAMVALASALIWPAPASAAQPTPAFALTVYVDCESASRSFACGVSASGATNPLTIRWSFNGVSIPSWNDRYMVRGGCQAGVSYRVAATVTDANGAQGSGGVTFVCRVNPW